MFLRIVGVFCLAITIVAFNLAGKKNNYECKSTVGFLVDTLAKDLTVPWEIIFLPDKTMLFTERSGKVRIYRNSKLLSQPSLVINEIDTTKKMGLLGMCIHPHFYKNKYLYLAYNYRNNSNALLKIVRYQFENDHLINPVTILENINASLNHTGCRLKFGVDEKLYITTGDADRPIYAQDLKSYNGKILRVNDDGSIPADNPFVKNDTARKEIWSYGHRNTQGIDFQPGTNQLFNSEHGPSGGDEINIVRKGANYGWPLIHHQDKKEGMLSPLREYTPSIGPSQILFYKANVFPSLKGCLLVACLRGEKIIRLEMKDNQVVAEEDLFQNNYGRIRALTEGPDGYIYFSTSQKDPPEGKPRQGYDMLLRLRPSSEKTISTSTNKKKEVARKSPVNKSPASIYSQLCASCHGNNLEGTERGKSLADSKWEYGSSKKSILKNIKQGVIEKGMPAWEGAITPKEMESLMGFILEKARKKR